MNFYSQKEQRFLNRQLKKVCHCEERAFSAKQEAAKVGKENAVVQALQKVFFHSFRIVMENGSTLVAKTCSQAKARERASAGRSALEQQLCQRNLKQLDRMAWQKALLNSGIVLAEGTALGVLGIGLPDVPVFLAMVLRAVYETAISYGFGYDTPEEQLYILYLLYIASSNGEEQRTASAKADALAYAIDTGRPVEVSPEQRREAEALAAKHMAAAVVGAKAMQGVFLIGAAGGTASCLLLKRVTKIAKIKYKKRLLQKLEYSGYPSQRAFFLQRHRQEELKKEEYPMESR